MKVSRLLALLFGIAVMIAARSTFAHVLIHDAWIPESPPGARMLAAYLVIDNQSAGPARLNAVSSPDFADISLHRTVFADGMARMQHLGGVTVAAWSQHALAPNGDHLMLMGPKRRLRAGDMVELTLRFGKNNLRTIRVPVVRRADRN